MDMHGGTRCPPVRRNEQAQARRVLGLDWTIEPPRNASAAEKADAEYLHELLLDLEGIEDLMLDCMDGVGHGYSAIELDWSLQDGSGRRPSTTGRRAGFN
ncbi:phage portal protein family protein [Pseudomonas aeruginosa]|uniref:phage portal protein family protein n=1 Tax=Pseudomonas aeruginosa TaxID=287 RepID=UPI0030F11D8F